MSIRDSEITADALYALYFDTAKLNSTGQHQWIQQISDKASNTTRNEGDRQHRTNRSTIERDSDNAARATQIASRTDFVDVWLMCR